MTVHTTQLVVWGLYRWLEGRLCTLLLMSLLPLVLTRRAGSGRQCSRLPARRVQLGPCPRNNDSRVSESGSSARTARVCVRASVCVWDGWAEESVIDCMSD